MGSVSPASTSTISRIGPRYQEAFHYDSASPNGQVPRGPSTGPGDHDHGQKVSGRNTFAEGRLSGSAIVQIFKVADVVSDPVNGLTLRVVGSESA